MNRTTPFLFVVAALSALLLGLAMFWLAVLPQRLTDGFIKAIENRTGMTVRVSRSSLDLFSGLALELNGVTLTDEEGQSGSVVTVEAMTAGLSWTNVLGRGFRLQNLELRSPVFALKTGEGHASSAVEMTEAGAADLGRKTRPLTTTIRSGTMKWSDARRQTVLAVTDINGSIASLEDGSATAELAGLVNGRLTRLSATIDDLKRVREQGAPADVTLISGQSNLSFSGRTRLNSGVGLDGRLSVTSDSLQSLTAWLGLPLSGFVDSGPLNAESALSWDGVNLDLKNLDASLGPSRIKGAATIDGSGERPKLHAALEADRFDLASYARSETTPSPPSSLAAPWNEKPMVFRDLLVLDADVTAAVGTLTVAGLRAQKAKLGLQLNSGNLTLTLASDDVAGGKAKAELGVQPGDKLPDLALSLDASGVSAKDFLQPLTGLSAINGELTLQAELQSQGDSTARLVSSSAGTVELSLKDGRIDGLALASFLADKGKGWRLQSDAATTIAAGHAAFDIQDGIARASVLELQSNGLKLTADGEIDLLRQSIDLLCRPEISGELKLPVQVAVSGPWTDPSVQTDIDPARLKPKALLKTGKKAIKKLFGN